MKNILEEIHSKPDSFFIKNRSNSFQNNINISEKLSSENLIIPNKKIKIDNYILNKKLGQGTFGIVVLAIHEITGEKVAIKILDKEKIFQNSEKNRFERKIQIMKKMYHKNIVHLYNVIENFKEIFLVMEYISGQELFDYITNKKRLDELESCKFYQQIISGIEYLSKTRVAHRDLKPENLLLDSKKTIKIVDFGLSNTYYENELLSTACGSPCYAAPEILQGKKYKGVEVDIWSSGIILYAMLCGYLPFEDKNNPTLYKKIIKGEFTTPEFLSPEAVDFLHRILNIEPKNRFNIEQIKTHPWFNLTNPKINMSEGLLIDKYIIPFDEEIIREMVERYYFNEQIVKINLIINKHNHITATYYLMLQKKIRNRKDTIGDMDSKLFLDYIHDSNNLLVKYHYDINKIIEERIFNKEKNNILIKENNKNKNDELNIFENNYSRKPEINLNNNMILNLTKKSNYNKKESMKLEKKYIKINNSKKLQTIESEKDNSNKKLNLKKINFNSNDKRNYISFREDKNKFKNRKKIKYYVVPKNELSHKYFNSTYSENKRNISQANDEISMDDNCGKKFKNKIDSLKESIVKNINHNIINNIQKTDNNISMKSKEYHFNSYISSPKSNSKNSGNKSSNRYKILKTENNNFINQKKKYENKNSNEKEAIRIIKKRKVNTNVEENNNILLSEENTNYNNHSKINYTKKHLQINSSSRISKTPNNILRNLNNKLILEKNIKNDLDTKLDNNTYKNDKNINNFVTNNNNNINININFTNIIKGEKYKKREENVSSQKKDRIFTNYKGIDDLFRLNKFLDNSIKGKNYFFNTSVSLEKGRRQTESENKNNRNLLIYSNNNKNLYDKNNRYNNKKESSTKRKMKDNKYLKIKAKNKKFNDSKIKKMKKNSCKKNGIHSNNSLNISEFKDHLKLIDNRNTNIFFNTQFNIKDNKINNNKQNSSQTKNNINYIRINCSKKLIDSNIKKRQTFKRLNTDIHQHLNNNTNFSLTNINFFSNIKNNLIYLKEIKEKTTTHLNSKKIKIFPNNNIINNNYLNPFDLNSIIILKEGSDVKQKICNFLDNKNIKFRISGNNKFICSKSDMELEIKIIKINHEDNNKVYIIRTFHKMFKSIKTKNLYFKYISKLINNIK